MKKIYRLGFRWIKFQENKFYFIFRIKIYFLTQFRTWQQGGDLKIKLKTIKSLPGV